MKKLTLLVFALSLTCTLFASDYDYKFRLSLTDKGTTSYSIDRPEEFLSEKAIVRRERQNIAIDHTDIPISESYIRTIEDMGAIVVAQSKWLKTISVHCSDSTKVEALKELPFVQEVKFVWRGQKVVPDTTSAETEIMELLAVNDSMHVTYDNYYGFGETNINLENGQYIHQAGYKGKGMYIAVIDAGYSNLSHIALLDNIDVKDSKIFIYGKQNIFDSANQHGLNVLSCMASNKPYQFVGTAPEASYILLTSEDSNSEYPIEEDYWANAIEYADSLGVDVVNTSLGYTKFDAPASSFEHHDLNGRTTMISRAADMAAEKGIFVVCSAGNSGNGEWKKLSTPADADGILTVGAVKRDSTISNFSSRGFTADMRIKPDVVGLGVNAAVIDQNGLMVLKNGTSFSSPIVCGLVACLWQAYPSLTNKELLQVIQQTADRYSVPDAAYGYGLPNMKKAMELAKIVCENKINQ